MMYDLIVVGGGAAGFFAAIHYAQERTQKVLILEQSKQVLQKVRISGGGRCNVTHKELPVKEFVENYPRGKRSLIGPFHHWSASDTRDWFEARGVELKVEPDGRVFPVSNQSETIINCLMQSAKNAGVRVQTRCIVEQIVMTELDPSSPEKGTYFRVDTQRGDSLRARQVLLATGGTRLSLGARLAESFGHQLASPVASLFTFKIKDSLLTDLQGLSVASVEASIEGERSLTSLGPVLITHWGLSGPGILKLSSRGAVELSKKDYCFTLRLNWLPHKASEEIIQSLIEARKHFGKKELAKQCPFKEIPKRLWKRILGKALIPKGQSWSQLTKEQRADLLNQLQNTRLHVEGKATNKEEFVTAGGVPLSEVNLKTMESKKQAGLYFAGEILNVDGLTGGFNFQNAWTSAYLAASGMRSL